jgi:hypothetical protein
MRMSECASCGDHFVATTAAQAANSICPACTGTPAKTSGMSRGRMIFLALLAFAGGAAFIVVALVGLAVFVASQRLPFHFGDRVLVTAKGGGMWIIAKSETDWRRIEKLLDDDDDRIRLYDDRWEGVAFPSTATFRRGSGNFAQIEADVPNYDGTPQTFVGYVSLREVNIKPATPDDIATVAAAFKAKQVDFAAKEAAKKVVD